MSGFAGIGGGGGLPAGSLAGDLFGLLQQASFRGVTFGMVDARHVVGRRLVQFLFPGRDTRAWDDMGAFDGPILVRGLMIGDDYVIRARRMMAAMRTPGPGTLVHPWLGTMQVFLTEPAEIVFDDRELRVARFQAVFQIADPSAATATDTLTQLADAADALFDQATIAIQDVLSPLALPLAVVGFVGGFMSQAGGMWTSLTGGGVSAAAFGAAVAPPVAALSAAANLVPAPGGNAAYAAQVAALLEAPCDAIADAADPQPAAAVAPATAPAVAVPDPRDAANLLLSAIPLLAAAPTATPVEQVIGFAAQCQAAAAAVSIAAAITYTSQQEALAWKATLDAALAGLVTTAIGLCEQSALTAGAFWPALRGLRSALALDINSRLGRLPVVVTITTPATVSAWIIANAVAGDAPGAIIPAFLDIVARNGVRHPALVPAGAVQVLAQPAMPPGTIAP